MIVLFMRIFKIYFIFYELSELFLKVFSNFLRVCGILFGLFKRWERKCCVERGVVFIYVFKGLEVRSNFSLELLGNGEVFFCGIEVFFVL